jgi:hypothetical protein
MAVKRGRILQSIWICVFWFAVLCRLACAQPATQPLELQRIKERIKIDGMSDEPAWKEITPFRLVMLAPDAGAEPTEKSEVRISYDSEYLYASASFYDSDPSKIQENSLYRDQWRGDDTFEIVIDSLNDNENAVRFLTTPAGIRLDDAIFNDAEGDDPFNINWNTFWDVAAVRNLQGWFAEIRIPFSSLRFHGGQDRVVMGLTIRRYIARKNEIDVFPARDSKYNRAGFKPSLGQDVVLQINQHPKAVHVTPYLLGGFDQTTSLDSARNRYFSENDLAHEAGLDLKYGLSSDLTLDATLNTDFAQVEADDAQVNLTRFSLFFPEKRQFFQERSYLFDFSLGASNRLFYSRRIGITEDGLPVRIFGGVRLMGRLGSWDIGLLNMQTASMEKSASENFGVFRLRRSVLNSYSYLGGMLVTRATVDGKHNIAYGLDSTVRLGENDFIRTNLAGTLEDDPPFAGNKFLDAGFSQLVWERPVREGLGYRWGFSYAGRNFNPESGFIDRHDFHFFEQKLSWGWNPKSSPVRNFMLALNSFGYMRNSDHSVESAEIRNVWEVDFRSGNFLYIAPKIIFEDLREPFVLSEKASVASGSYAAPGAQFYYSSPWGKEAGFEVESHVGKYYDGNRVTLIVWPRWYVSRFVELSGQYRIDQIHFPQRRESFLSQIGRLRMNLSWNTRASLSSFFQFSTVEKRAGLNVRFRYNPREGYDIYLVYNQGLNLDRGELSPAPPISTGRTFLVKYVYTFDLSR